MKFQKIKFLLSSLFIFCSLFGVAHAQPLDSSDVTDQTEAFQSEVNFGDATVGEIIATAIKAFLGLLAVIFIILIITAGFKWMTAQGNEEKVKEAKDTIKRAVIGIIIIMAAYAITDFVFEALSEASGGGNNPPPTTG